jgi:predicted DNA-binding protein with PD1-like motif
MQVRRVGERYVVRLEADDEVMASLRAWADQHGVGFATLQAIGALRRATLGYLEPVTREYRHFSVEEQVEVLCLSGNVSRGEDASAAVHAHAVLGKHDGQTVGGHLVEGFVFPTLEVVLFVLPETVVRRLDPASGLALWDLG